MKIKIVAIAIFISVSFGYSQNYKIGEVVKVPDRFKIELYASNVPGARSMALSNSGVLFVGSRKEGKVYALVDNNKDLKIDEVVVIASGLDMPNGVAINGNDLYVAEVSRVIKFSNIETTFRNSPNYTIVKDDFKNDRAHGWKFIRFSPDGKLYIPVGAPCNNCLREDDPRYASISRMDKDGSNFEIFAKGIRNTVGFDWHPQTKELWFTDNGRDELGDNIPPDELNHAPVKGLDFGYPFLHGSTISDPVYGDKKGDRSFTKPVQELGPHVAALGMRFYTGDMFPKEYKNQIFIAEHGSWNRSKKIGYRVTTVKLDGNRSVSYEPFAVGWLENEKVFGRPVDIEIMRDGSILVSDDYAGAIYRISYN